MAITTNTSSITIAASNIAAVGSFNITNNRAALEITELGESTRKFTHGIQDATASLTLFYDQGSTSHTTLEGLVASPVASAFVITLATGQTYSFSAYVTSFAIDATAGELIQATVQLQVTGSVTIA
jgi:hypothetical protein